MYKNSSIPSNNTALWYYLGTKQLDLRCESNSTPGVLIEEIWYLLFNFSCTLITVSIHSWVAYLSYGTRAYISGLCSYALQVSQREARGS